MAKTRGKVKAVSAAELAKTLGGGKGAERRTEERVPARLDVEVPLARWEDFRRVWSTNLSKGGMMFTLVPPAAIPAAVNLVVTLPDGQQVTLATEVRHVARREGKGEYEVGVQFQLDGESRRAIDAALAALDKK